MKKLIIAAAIIAVTGLASLTVSSKATNVIPVEKVKLDVTEFNRTEGFGVHKNDLATAD